MAGSAYFEFVICILTFMDSRVLGQCFDRFKNLSTKIRPLRPILNYIYISNYDTRVTVEDRFYGKKRDFENTSE